MLEQHVPRASCLRLEHGNMMCGTCHDVATVICELGKDVATGTSLAVIELKELARQHEAMQVAFDQAAERRRKRAEAEEKKAQSKSCQPQPLTPLMSSQSK